MKQIFWFYLEEFYFMKITFNVIIIFCEAGGKYFSALQVILFFKEKEYNIGIKKVFFLVEAIPFGGSRFF